MTLNLEPSDSSVVVEDFDRARQALIAACRELVKAYPDQALDEIASTSRALYGVYVVESTQR